MTIAACFLTTEGVVFGSDSTSTINYKDPSNNPVEHYNNFAQKIFEFGLDSTLGIVTWGVGGLGDLSYRTMVAEVADSGQTQNFVSVLDVAKRWADRFWAEYLKFFAAEINTAKALKAKQPQTIGEIEQLEKLSNGLTTGFCIGGYVTTDRKAAAYEIVFHPLLDSPPVPDPLVIGQPRFWGAPTIIKRITWGIDFGLVDDIVNSGLWTGDEKQLLELADRHHLTTPTRLPIREAIDYVDSVIYTTVKGVKFSQWDPICGGPVEVAVITSDRRFRWVKHKSLAAALDQPPTY